MRYILLSLLGILIITTGCKTNPKNASSAQKEESYIISVNHEAVVQRGFFMHEGKKQTHVIAVGLPGNINYVYSLGNYNIQSVWRGQFVDVADMWSGRGDKQLGKPLGDVTELAGKPAVNMLKSANDPWPDSVAIDGGVFTKRGYRLLKDGIPEFLYTYKNIDITDYVYPDSSGQNLVREVSFNFHEAGNKLYFLLAEGRLIKALPDGGYAVDDYNYHVNDVQGSSQPPVIVKSGDHHRLLVVVEPKDHLAKIKYNITW